MVGMLRCATMCFLLTTVAGCYLSDDEGGRTRREMDQSFEESTGGERGGTPGDCDDATDPDCAAPAEPVRCRGGYPECPDGAACVDDPARGCSVANDPTCPGLCE